MQRFEDDRRTEEGDGGSSDQQEFAALAARHWREILGTPPEDQPDFSCAGGTSIDLVELQLRLLRDGSVSLDLARLPDPLTFDALLESVESISKDSDGERDTSDSSSHVGGVLEGPANGAQIEQWIAEKIQPESLEYLVPIRVEVPDGTTWAALDLAIVAVTNAHSSLRTSIHNVDGNDSEFVQRIHPPVRSSGLISRPAWIVDNGMPEFLRGGSVSMPTVESERKYQAIGLVKNGRIDSVLLVFHHVAVDDHSLSLIVRDLAGALRGEPCGEEDGSLLEWSAATNAKVAEMLEWWRHRLESVPAGLDLETSETEPVAVSSSEEAVHRIDQDVVDVIDERLREYGVMRSAAAIGILRDVLYEMELACGDSVAIGTPMSLRDHPRVLGTTGMFLNTVPVVVDQDSELVEVASDLWETKARRRVPYLDIVEAISPARIPGRSAWLDACIGIMESRESQPLPWELVSPGETPFPILVMARWTPKGLDITCQVQTRFGGRQLAGLILEAFTRGMARLADKKTWEPKPRSVLVGRPSASVDRTVVDLVSDRIISSPTADAIVDDGGSAVLDFRAIEVLSSRVAAAIMTAGGVPGETVTLIFDHGSELPIATLAAMQSGCVATPVPADTPPSRLSRLIDLAGSRVLVTTKSILRTADISDFDGEVVVYDEVIEREFTDVQYPIVSEEDPAYLLFTSGSTGDPKPVLMPHRALANLVAYEVNRSPAVGTGRCAQFQAVGFDSSLLEIFASWARNEALYPVPSRLRNDPVELIDFLERNRISRIHLPPLMARAMAGSARPIPDSIREIICTGEALRIDGPLRSAGRARPFNLVNQYGPTETHVVTSLDLGSDPSDWPEIPDIGVPIDGVTVRIEDPEGRVVDQGRPGEIVIEGVMVGLGYLGDQTGGFEEREGIPRYRTGDVGRALPSGRIEFLGRRDGQVKISGFRVEPAEVEAAISEIPGVLDSAVVAVLESGDARLHAFVEGRDLEAPTAMKQRLEGVLPRWLVPSDVAILDTLPKTVSGKIDRKALQAAAMLSGRSKTVADESVDDPIIAELYQALPELKPLQLLHDRTLLESGIDSLAAIRVQSALDRGHGVSMSVRSILVASPSMILDEIRKGTSESRPVAIESATTVESAPSEIGDWAPLDPLVRDVLATDALSPSGVFHMAWRIKVARPLDVDELRERFTAIRARFPSLRSRWSASSGTRVVPLGECGDFDLTLYDQRPSKEVQGQFLHQRISLEFVDPIRVVAWPEPDGGHEIMVVIHHVAADGVLAGEMFNEFFDPRADRPSLGEDSSMSSAVNANDLGDLDWWTSRLKELLGEDGLPMSDLRSGADSEQFYTATDDASLKAAMEHAAREQPYGRVTYGLAAWALVIAHRLGRDQVVIGVPFAMDSKQGLSANMLPIIAKIGGQTVGGLLDSISVQIADAIEHRCASLGSIAAAMSGDKHHLRPPVDAVLTVDDLVRDLGDGVVIQWQPTQSSSFQASAVVPQASSIFGIEVEGGFLDGEAPESMLQRWMYVIEKIVGLGSSVGTEVRADSIDVLLPSMLAELAAFGEPEKVHDSGQSALQRFDLMLADHHDDVAVIDDSGSITYAELDAWSRCIAGRLMDQGVKAGDPVAIAADRGIATSAALLGILRAGGWYVPVEQDIPDARKVIQIKASGCKVGVQSAAADCFPPELLPVIDPDSCRGEDSDLFEFPGDDAQCVSGDSPMYGMFTSGTTGEPRCVIVPHRAVNRLVDDPFFISLEKPSMMLNAASLAFDASTIEIWGPLLNGGAVAVWTGHSADLVGIAGFLRKNGVNACWLTAALFNAAVDTLPGFFQPISTVMTGGDVVSINHVRKLMAEHPGLTVVNGYGPTENTVFTTCEVVPPGSPPPGDFLSVGRPVRGTRVRIVDDAGCLVPKGRFGQLVVEGEGLALGYLGASGQVEPTGGFRSSDDGTIKEYHTGDFARWMPSGQLQFGGRRDHQVKIAGHRIELTAIDHALRSMATIQDACTCLIKRDDRTVLGAVVIQNPGVVFNEDAIRGALKQSLFSWEIPSKILGLSEMPITLNGKPDRVKIAERFESLTEMDSRVPITQAGDLTDLVLQTVQKMVASRRIEPATGLRHQGLDSLDMLRLAIELEKVLGRPIHLSGILTDSSVASIARSIAEDIDREGDPIVTLHPGAALCRTGIFCIPGVGGTVFSFERILEGLPSWCPVYGLPYPGISGDRKPISRVGDLADVLVESSISKLPKNPILVGYSFGGFVAFECARRLIERGYDPIVLAIDAAPASLAMYRGRSGTFRNWKLKLENVLPQSLIKRVGLNKSFAVKRLRSVVAASFEAIRHYSPEPLDVPVCLLRTKETDFSPFHEVEDLGWRDLTSRFTIEYLPGEHLDVFRVASMELAQRICEKASRGRRDD